MKTRKYIIESKEEALGSELFEISVCSEETEEQIRQNFKIASLFADWSLTDFETFEDAVEQYPILSNISKETFEDCVFERKNGNGQDGFNSYIEKCGYEVSNLSSLSPDFTYEW